MNRWGYVACTAIVLLCGVYITCGSRAVSPLSPVPQVRWQYGGELQVGSISPFPNQSAIAYSFSRSGPSHLYTVSWNGQKTRQVTRDARADSDVCVSPGGTFLVFVRQDGDTLHLWRMNADGAGQHQLTFGPGCETEPSISPDGRKIAYVESAPTAGSTYALGVMKADGTQRRRLTSGSSAIQDTTPVFDPTGTRVYFTRVWLNNSPGLRGEVWAIKIAGGGAHRIGFGDDPAVSPSGRKIAFLDQPQNQTLGIMNTDGAGRTIIGRNMGYGTCLKYSPNGQSLLLDTSFQNGGTIWAIPTNGVGRRLVTTVK